MVHRYPDGPGLDSGYGVNSICLTANMDIIYWTTTEGGKVGTRSGLHMALAPDYTRSVLLADTTGARSRSPTSPGFSYGDLAQNMTWTFPVPTLA